MNTPDHGARQDTNHDTGHDADQRVASPSDNPGDPYPNLARYGLTEAVSKLFTRITHISTGDPELVPGRVVRVDGISTAVHTSTRDYRAVSTLAIFAQPDELIAGPAQPTVGDWVLIRPGQDNEPDTIELVLPRTSLLVRKRVMRGKQRGDEQLLAANVSNVFIVQSVTYFNAARLERELALVWGSGSVPVVVMTKTDLLEGAGRAEMTALGEVVQMAESVAPGVEVFAVSGITGEGTGPLDRFTTTGKTVVLIGASGVGKSTLVNQLMGEEVMDTGEIRESDDRGRHTTTTRQLMPLPGGGVLIDSPGIRTIGLVAGSKEAIAKTFPDVEEYLGKCKFRNCTHGGEPECSITRAIADGRLLQSRFDSYRRMQREIQFEETQNDPAAKTDHQVRVRAIAKSARQKERLDSDDDFE